MKKILPLFFVILIIFSFNLTAYADIIYVDPEEYGFDVSVTETYLDLPEFKESKPYIVTFDDDNKYYKIVNDLWGDDPTISYGTYKNNDYCLIKSNSGYTYSYVYDSSTLEWKTVKEFNYGYIVLGNSYIKENLTNLATHLGVSPAEFYYCGSNILMNNNWESTFNSVKNFFPHTPVTVLTTALRPATMLQGIMKEIVELFPVLIPLLIGFLALRKGLKMVFYQLKTA